MKIVAMVQIDTDDPRLFPSHDMVATAEKTQEVRRLLIEALPRLERVIAIFDVGHARLLMQLHEGVGDQIAEFLGQRSGFARPPADYRPPGKGGA